MVAERNRETFEEWFQGKDDERVHYCRDLTVAEVCRTAMKYIEEEIVDTGKFYAAVKNLAAAVAEHYYEVSWNGRKMRSWESYESWVVAPVVATALIGIFGVKGEAPVILCPTTRDDVLKRFNKKEHE